MYIGRLSEKYESNGDPGAIGYDAGGGFSYGSSQIATIPGTFGYFLDFCKQRYPDIYETLELAGGFNAALSCTPVFKAAWVLLAAKDEPVFAQCQHEFIVETQYGVTIKRLKTTGIDLASPPRTNTLADVIYSLSVMAGPGSPKINGSGCCGLIFDALILMSLKNISGISDAALIEAFYKEKLHRIDSGREYKADSAKIVKSVRDRVVSEHLDAVAELARELSAS